MCGSPTRETAHRVCTNLWWRQAIVRRGIDAKSVVIALSSKFGSEEVGCIFAATKANEQDWMDGKRYGARYALVETTLVYVILEEVVASIQGLVAKFKLHGSQRQHNLVRAGEMKWHGLSIVSQHVAQLRVVLSHSKVDFQDIQEIL